MNEKEKIKEWIHINRSLLEIYEIFVFLLVTEEKLTKEKDEILLFDHLTDLFYVFSNIGKVYSISEMAKLIDPDNNSISLFDFVGKFYKSEEDIVKEFRNWKRETNATRKIVLNARNRFSAHTDKDSFHQDENFGLYIDDVNKFILRTFSFLDLLYEKDEVLKTNFNKQICPATLGGEKPSNAANGWKITMAHRIKYLQDNLKGTSRLFKI